MILAAIRRGDDVLIPRGNTVLESADTIVIASESAAGDEHVELKQITLLEHNPWNDQYVRDLDISRQTLIVMVKRGNRIIIPQGDTRLRAGDVVLVHSKVPVLAGKETDLDI